MLRFSRETGNCLVDEELWEILIVINYIKNNNNNRWQINKKDYKPLEVILDKIKIPKGLFFFTRMSHCVKWCLRGYSQFGQDRLELLAAGFLIPLRHLVQERRVGLGHDDCRRRRRSTQLSKTTKPLTTITPSQSLEITQFNTTASPFTFVKRRFASQVSTETNVF